MSDIGFIHCKVCKYSMEVSDEDPDASLSDMFDHVRSRHPNSGLDVVGGGKG